MEAHITNAKRVFSNDKDEDRKRVKLENEDAAEPPCQKPVATLAIFQGSGYFYHEGPLDVSIREMLIKSIIGNVTFANKILVFSVIRGLTTDACADYVKTARKNMIDLDIEYNRESMAKWARIGPADITTFTEKHHTCMILI